MQYRRLRPTSPLRDVVDFVWCLRDGPTHARERVLPGGTAELVINLSADRIAISTGRQRCDRRYSGAVLSGPYTESFDIDPSAHTAMIGVHFRPGGARAVLPMPLSDIADTHLDLEDVWGRRGRTLQLRVCEAGTDTERVTIVAQALSTWCAAHDGRDARAEIHDAVTALTTRQPPPPIAEVVARSGLSHRRFVELFTDRVGMTPKLFSRIQRFRVGLRSLQSGPVPSWPGFAVEHGYSDQSHMIREFRALSGMTPVEHQQMHAVAAKDDHVAVPT